MRQRVLFTTFCLDRRISLICGRPSGMRTEDIAVHSPSGLLDEDAYLESPLPGPSTASTIQPYMDHYAAYARFVGSAWNAIACPTVDQQAAGEAAERLDDELAGWVSEFDLAGELAGGATHPQKQQRLIVRLVSCPHPRRSEANPSSCSIFAFYCAGRRLLRPTTTPASVSCAGRWLVRW
jgi:hypothetical protein